MKLKTERVDIVQCPRVNTIVRVYDKSRQLLSCVDCQYYRGRNVASGHISCDFGAENEEPQLRRWVVYVTQKEYLAFHVDAFTPEDAKEMVLAGKVDPYATLDSEFTDIEVEAT